MSSLSIVRFIIHLLATLSLMVIFVPTWVHSSDKFLQLGQDAPLAWLEDTTGTLTIDQIAKLPPERFKTDNSLTEGYTRSIYWVRIIVPAPSTGNNAWWLELIPPVLDYVDVFEPEATGWKQTKVGDLVPRSKLPIDYRNFVIPLQSQTAQIIFIRIQSSSSLLLAGRLWSATDFMEHASQDSFYWGIFFGLAGLSSLLSISMAILLRRNQLWALSAFSFAYLVVASNLGLIGWLAPLDNTNISNMITSFAVLLSQAASLWLISELLEFKQHFPRFNRVLQGLIISLIIACLSVPMDFYSEIISGILIISALSKIIIVIAGLILWQRHGSYYGWVTLAYALHISLVTFSALALLGVLSFKTWILQFWNYELIILMLFIVMMAMVQLRKDHTRRLNAATEALLSTEQASQLLSQHVQERTQELQATRDQLAQTLQDEQEAHLQQRQFASLISHEFRTPLALIDSVINNLALIPPETESDLNTRINHIRSANNQLVLLSDTCLADARLEAGMLKSCRQDVIDVLSLINSTIDSLYGTPSNPLNNLPRPNIECTASKPMLIKGDPGLLRIALSNVLSNAQKYSSGKDIEIRLIIQSKAENNELLIQIQDHGPGITPKEQEHLFQRFARGSNTSHMRGNGLGLYISREIMRAHGAELRLITVANSACSGCVFEFQITLLPHV